MKIRFEAVKIFMPLLVLCGYRAQADTIYVSTYNDGTIYRFAADGSGGAFAIGPGGQAGLAIDNAGNLYAASAFDSWIEKYTPDGNSTYFASNYGPVGVACDGAGNVYVADIYHGIITKYDSLGNPSAFAADSGGEGALGLAFDVGGNLYCANIDNNTIEKIKSNGGVSSFAADVGDSDAFDGPNYLACDGAGNIYVSCDSTIKKFTPSGGASHFATSANCSGSLCGPLGVACDSAGNVYVANNGTGQIVKFTPSGDYSIFASVPSPVGIAIQHDCQSLDFTSYKQGDAAANSDVPLTFGTMPSSTQNFGCALCSLATMLTSFGNSYLVDPNTLNAKLLSHDGYSSSDEIDFCAVHRIFPAITYAPFGKTPDLNPAIDYNIFLSNHFCTWGERVILQLTEQTGKHHYVLVTGANGDDWNVFDPGWKTSTPPSALSSLQGHLNGFTDSLQHYRSFVVSGFRTFKLAGSTAAFWGAKCPVNILVIDPNGNSVGFDAASGSNVFQIPGATYSVDGPMLDVTTNGGPGLGDAYGTKTIYIPDPQGGVYQLAGAGVDTGSYALQFEAQSANGDLLAAPVFGEVNAGVIFSNNFASVLPPFINILNYKQNALSFSFLTQTNVTYFVECTSNLNSGWLPFQTVTGTGGIVRIDTTNTNAMEFYHVKAQ